MTSSVDGLVVRPLELVQLIARAGAGHALPDLGDERLTAIASAIARNPRVPLGLKLYGGNRYNGTDAKAPDGVLFSLLADQEIICQIFSRQSEAAYTHDSCARIVGSGTQILLSIAGRLRMGNGLEEVCPTQDAGYTPAWTGPAGFSHEDYEKGRPIVQEWIKGLIPTFNRWKTNAELAAIRKISVPEMDRAEALRIFPAHLLYIMCQFGGCADLMRGQVEMADNMYEVGLAIRRNPDRPLMFVPEHCMLCPTCRSYDPDGCGLCGIQPESLLPPARNNMCGRLQLRLLRTLGMEYYQPAPAVSIVRKTFEKVQTDHTSFTYEGAPPSAFGYARCRYSGLGFLEAYDDPEAVVRRVTELLDRPDVKLVLPDADRSHVESVLKIARHALERQNRLKAYQALIDEPFHFLWKFYLEKIAGGCARLPPNIPVERREEKGLPVARAERLADCDRLTACLDSDSWMRRPFASGFKTIGGRPAIAGTAFRVFYDHHSLVIGCIGADADPAAIKAEHRTGTQARIGGDCYRHDREHWLHVDDSFTLMLRPNEQAEDFFIFTFNARGVKIGERRTTEAFIKRPAWVFDTDWRVSTRVGDNFWSGMAVIPFACLGTDGPGRAPWRLNVHRFVRNEALDPHSWSAPTPRSFYDRAAFGRLEFA